MEFGNLDYAANTFTVNNTKYCKIEEPALNIDDPVHKIDYFEGIKATGKNEELLKFIINENPDSMVSDEIELHILLSLMRGEEKIKMPALEDVGEQGLTFPERGIKNTQYSEREDKTQIGVCYDTCEKSDVNIKKTTYTGLTDFDNDGYADYLEMFAYDDETPCKDLAIDLDRYRGYSQIRWDTASTHSFRTSK